MPGEPKRKLGTTIGRAGIKGDASKEGRLLARPSGVGEAAPTTGLHSLRPGDARGDHLLYVPGSYEPERPAPLAVVLHGAGGRARDVVELLRPLSDAKGIVMLAPTSRGYTWDVIVGGYGPDVEALDGVLEDVFSRYALDPERFAIGGFSDGASYALSLGIDNGDLFSCVIAFSPGFMAPFARVGTPSFFVSHGTRDSVLPIGLCSRRIVPQLKRMGYGVTYREFEGGHTVPQEVSLEAFDRFVSGG